VYLTRLCFCCHTDNMFPRVLECVKYKVIQKLTAAAEEISARLYLIRTDLMGQGQGPGRVQCGDYITMYVQCFTWRYPITCLIMVQWLAHQPGVLKTWVKVPVTVTVQQGGTSGYRQGIVMEVTRDQQRIKQETVSFYDALLNSHKDEQLQDTGQTFQTDYWDLGEFLSQLSEVSQDALVEHLTSDELKDALWDCANG
jgi:hypothetical protein